jgi:hypothetical protein
MPEAQSTAPTWQLKFFVAGKGVERTDTLKIKPYPFREVD